MEFIHKSVLFDEAIAALELSENKIVADGTAGAATRAKSQKKQKGLSQLTAIPMPLRFSASALRSLIM